MLDETLKLLAHPRRRRVLLTLLDRGTKPTAAEQAAVVRAQSEQDLDIEMRHVHLPKLERAGIVVWDRKAETVEPGPHFEEVAPLVRLLHENQHQLPGRWL
jgi:hypothetical protein